MADQPTQRLGRGLAALLGGPVPADAGPPAAGMVDLPIDAIAPNPKQPRQRFDDTALETLAHSIRDSGLMQPVVVRSLPQEGRFELIAGERRWQAARRAGLTSIPAVVRDADDRTRLELALIENVVREDLNPMELARGVASLVEDFGQTHEHIATSLGRSRSAISNLLRLLELPDIVCQMVEDGRLSEGHARAILMVDGARARRQLAERVVAGGLSVRQTEAAARAGEATTRPSTPRQPFASPLDDAAIDVFYGLTEAPVKVRRVGGNAIVVEMRFASEDALHDVITRLSSTNPDD